MTYALLETADLDATAQQIGIQLEQELEKLKFQTLLPTAADWGYVFSIKEGMRKYNIAIVKINSQKFGLAIESSQDVVERFFNLFTTDRTKLIKEWIDDILAVDVVVKKIEWYCQKSWMSKFKINFWFY